MVVQRGRISSAAANVVRIVQPARSRLQAPKHLKKAEVDMFNMFVSINPHLTPTDTPLLAIYSQMLIATQRFKPGSSECERALRSVIALGRALRLTARSATHPDKVARKRGRINDDLAAAMRDHRADEDDANSDSEED